MKRLSLIPLVAVLYLYSCSSDDSSTTQDSTKTDAIRPTDSTALTAPATDNVPQLTMTIYDEDDNKLSLQLDDSTCYCLMASWCPHSKRIMYMVNNPHYDPLTKKHPLVFLYDKNEIDDLRGIVEKDPDHKGIAESDLPALYQKMSERKDEGKLMFPQVLSDIPDGVKYYYVDYNTLEYTPGDYPSAFHRRTQRFDVNPINWWFAYDQQDSILVKTMAAEYNQDK